MIHSTLSIRRFVLSICLAVSLAAGAKAQDRGVALTGTVASAEEGAMEGVLVRDRKSVV